LKSFAIFLKNRRKKSEERRVSTSSREMLRFVAVVVPKTKTRGEKEEAENVASTA
jgi:hypothetical protein